MVDTHQREALFKLGGGDVVSEDVGQLRLHLREQGAQRDPAVRIRIKLDLVVLDDRIVLVEPARLRGVAFLAGILRTEPVTVPHCGMFFLEHGDKDVFVCSGAHALVKQERLVADQASVDVLPSGQFLQVLEEARAYIVCFAEIYGSACIVQHVHALARIALVLKAAELAKRLVVKQGLIHVFQPILELGGHGGKKVEHIN